MENQRPSSRIPSIACTASRPGGWTDTPVSTTDMTIDELMAYIGHLNKKYKITK